ncbi:MAG: hypothetical protein PSU94_03020 [Lacunisphaera sp.]|nr:hypothetical protein [Lacunisphaera sp.]
MMPRRLIYLGLAATLLLPPGALATTVEPPEFKDLIGQADYVVRGVVVSLSSEWRQTDDGRRYIASQVEINVNDAIKGTPPEKVVLQFLGGRVGDDELVVEGAPKFQIGEEDIFFVHGNGRMISPFVGIMHGVYPVLHNFGSGQDYVLRSNGMPLYSEQDVSLPMTRLSDVKLQNPAAQPITAAAFIRQVRQVPAHGQPSVNEN